MSDNYQTDEWLFEIFERWFDPCPFNPDWEIDGSQDGLHISWPDRTFVNPPYSNPKVWVEKAIEENAQGKTIVMLLKHDSSTEWYRLLHEAGARFLLVNKRLKHRTKHWCAFPSVLAVLSK